MSYRHLEACDYCQLNLKRLIISWNWKGLNLIFRKLKENRKLGDGETRISEKVRNFKK